MTDAEYPYQCRHCECRRLDRLEEEVRDLKRIVQMHSTIKEKVANQERLLVAKDDLPQGTINRPGLMQKYGISRYTTQRWERMPGFPDPVVWGKRKRGAATLWNETRVEVWYEKHVTNPRVAAILRLKDEKRGPYAERE